MLGAVLEPGLFLMKRSPTTWGGSRFIAPSFFAGPKDSIDSTAFSVVDRRVAVAPTNPFALMPPRPQETDSDSLRPEWVAKPGPGQRTGAVRPG